MKPKTAMMLLWPPEAKKRRTTQQKRKNKMNEAKESRISSWFQQKMRKQRAVKQPERACCEYAGVSFCHRLYARLWHLQRYLSLRGPMLGLPSLEYRTITKVFLDLPGMWPTIAFVVPSPFNTIQPLSVFKHLLMDCFYFVLLCHDGSAGICWAKLYFGGVQLLHHRSPSVGEGRYRCTPGAL